MDYLIAAAFGLSIGTLLAYSLYPTRWLPYLCACVVLAIGVGVVAFRPATSPVLGVIIGGTSCVSGLLASGLARKEHPLLAPLGYWSRIWMMIWHEPTLRRFVAENPDHTRAS